MADPNPGKLPTDSDNTALFVTSDPETIAESSTSEPLPLASGEYEPLVASCSSSQGHVNDDDLAVDRLLHAFSVVLQQTNLTHAIHAWTQYDPFAEKLTATQLFKLATDYQRIDVVEHLLKLSKHEGETAIECLRFSWSHAYELCSKARVSNHEETLTYLSKCKHLGFIPDLEIGVTVRGDTPAKLIYQMLMFQAFSHEKLKGISSMFLDWDRISIEDRKQLKDSLSFYIENNYYANLILLVHHQAEQIMQVELRSGYISEPETILKTLNQQMQELLSDAGLALILDVLEGLLNYSGKSTFLPLKFLDNKDKNALLTLALKRRKSDKAVIYLLANGANPNVTDAYGISASIIARFSGADAYFDNAKLLPVSILQTVCDELLCHPRLFNTDTGKMSQEGYDCLRNLAASLHTANFSGSRHTVFTSSGNDEILDGHEYDESSEYSESDESSQYDESVDDSGAADVIRPPSL